MNESPPTELIKWRREEEEAFAAGDFARLAEALTRCAELYTEPAEKAGALYRAGCAALKAGDRDGAVDRLAKVEAVPRWERAARLTLLEIYWLGSEWEKYLSVVDRELADPQWWDEIALRLEKARILAFRLGHMAEAEAELAAVLSKNSGSIEARWLRLVLALRSGAWETAAAAYQDLLTVAGPEADPDFGQSLLMRLGQIYEFRFKKPDEARAWYEKLDREQAPVLARYPLFELDEAGGRWDQASTVLSEILAAEVPDAADSQVSLRLMLARAREDALGDQAGADADYQDLARKFPDDFGVLYTAAERGLEIGTPEQRADLDQKIMARLDDQREKSYFAADRVRVLLEDMQTPGQAVESAREWLASSPEDLSAGRWLIESLIRAGQNKEALDEINREIGRTQDPREKQGLLLKKAELAAMRLDDNAAAIAAYRESLAVPPSQFPILLSMSRLYHLNRDYGNLAKVVTAAIKLITDERVQRFYKGWLAAIYLERLGEDNQAFAMFGELLKTDPNDLTALKTIARLARRNGSWQNYAGALSRIADAAQDPTLQAELRSKLAWTYELRLNRADLAKKLYTELAARKAPFALEALRRLAGREQDLSEYASRLVELSEQDQGNLRAARLVRLGGAYEVMGRLSESWVAYEKARVSLMQKPHLFLPMIDLAQLSGYWIRYMALVEEFAARLSDSNKKALMWEAAWCRSEMPANDDRIDVDAMQRSFKALEELDEDCQSALRGSWLAALLADDHKGRADLFVRMIKHAGEDGGLTLRLKLGYLLKDNLGANEEAIAAFRQVLAKDQKQAPLIRELALMYEQAGQWGELIRMLLLEIQVRKEPELIIDLYSRLAQLYEEKFKALDEAVKCWQAVLKIRPDLQPGHDQLMRLLEARERWEDLVAAAVAREKVTAETPAKVDLFLKAAAVLDEKIKDANRAIEILKQALDLDPERPETFMALSRIYEREQRWPELVSILEEQIERMSAAEGKAAIHEQIADIYENRIKDNAKAIEQLVTARDLDPNRTSVLLSLERLFTTEQRWEELIDTLERLAAPAEPAAQLEYFSRIGVLWDEKLGKLPESVESWERARAVDGQNVPAHEALVSLYERTGQDQLFVERTGALAELVVADKARAVGLIGRAAAVLETRLNDDLGAISLYRRAMEIDNHAVAPVSAARAIYERREEWPEVVSLLEREESITDEVEKKLEIFTRIGNIHEQQLTDPDAASAAYAKALTLKGDYLPAVRPQAEIFYTKEKWAEARPLYEIWTGALEGEAADKSAEIWYKSGWCAESTEDVPNAMKRYHSSIEAVAVYRPPLERLSELYTNQKKWPEAGNITSRLLVVAREAADNEAAFMLLGRLSVIEEKLDQLDKAADALEQALAIKPGHYDTLDRLVDLYERQENWKKVLVTYDLLIRSAPNTDLQAKGLVGKGCVLEDKLKEEASALAHFQKAAQIAPKDLLAWQRLSAIYLRKESWPEAEKSLSQVIVLEPDAQKKVEPHYNLGRVYMVGLSDIASARLQFEAALQIDNLHVPSMESLGDIYLQQEEWEKFIATSESFIRLVPPEKQPSLVSLFIKMGAVYRDHLKNKERAIISYQQAAKHEPDNHDIKGELAAIYASDPKFIDQAKAENLTLIKSQPFRTQSYRDLANIYKSQNNLDAQFCIYSILKLLGSLDYEEEIFLEANQGKIKKSSKRTLKEVDRQGYLLHPDEKGPLRDMLVTMAPNLGKQLPTSLDKINANKRTLMPEKMSSPIVDLVIEFANDPNNLGFEGNITPYINPQQAEPQVMYNGDHHHVIFNPEWFKRFSPEEQRFLVGRLVEHMINYHDLAMHVPADQLIRILSLIALGADAKLNLQVPGVADGDLDKQRKAGRKLIPRKLQGNVEHIASRFSQETVNLDAAKWKNAMEHTANRAGLLVCGDLFAALNAIVKTDPRSKDINMESVTDPQEIWSKNEFAAELMAFAVSDAYFRLRDRAGFSIV